MSFNSFLPDILATILGGIILTLFFFFTKEKIFPSPNINGLWKLIVYTEKTIYNPFRSMTLEYDVLLWSENNNIYGTVEKCYEDSVNGKIRFEGDRRTTGVVQGSINKNYFGKDKILLKKKKKGRRRQSSHYYDLIVSDDVIISGTFQSLIAKQEGVAFLIKA